MPHVQPLQGSRLVETAAQRGGLHARTIGRCARQIEVETRMTIDVEEAERMDRDIGLVESFTCMSGMFQP